MASKPLRVGVVTYAMYGGGMERVILSLGHQLSAKGFDVTVVTEERQGAWFGRVQTSGLSSEHVPGWGDHHALAHGLEVGRALARGHFDVVFLSHAHFAQSSLALLGDHIVAIPMLHLDMPSMYRVGCSSPSLWNVAVAVSPRVQAKALRRSRDKRPIVCIPNGVELPTEAAWRRRAPYDGLLRLCYVGRIHDRHKGVFLLVDIVERCIAEGLESLRLTVVGDGPDLPELKRRVHTARLGHKIECLGDVEPQDVMPHLLSGHALLMPSWFEGLGNVALEAQACGCVPIASRLPGVTDMTVEEGQTGFLVEPGDVGGFVERIRTLYHDRMLCAEMGLAGRERMRASFSLGAMGDAYETLIRDALAGKYPLPRSRRRMFPIDLTLFQWPEFLPMPFRRIGRRIRDRFRPG